MSKNNTVVLTGGGTAGHVVSNIAIIPLLKEADINIHYFGTKDGIERDMISAIDDVEYHQVKSGKLRRYFSLQNFVDPFKIIAGYFEARKALKKVQPSVVFSKGGFVTVPVVFAAKRLGIPVVLHESDYTPGLANKLGIGAASEVLVTFEDTLEFVGSKGKLAGIPIRPEILNASAERGREFLGFDGNKPILLIMGGSQGAQAINEAIQDSLVELKKRFDIVHLTGKNKSLGLVEDESYRVFEYLDDEMPDVLAAADFAIARAGANSIFEFLAADIPALLIPLPLSASRGDQIQNAEYFERKGYAKVLEQEKLEEKDALVNAINELYSEKDVYLEKIREAHAADSSEKVVAEILKYTNINSNVSVVK